MTSEPRSRCVWQRLRHLCAISLVIASGCASGASVGGPDAGPASDPDGAPPWADAAGQPDASPAAPDADVQPRKRIVILMIGDGMGPGQLEAASQFRHGSAGALFMQSLPVQGTIASASLSGITDSAAAATTMATGQVTFNGRIGIDRDGVPQETLVEAAQRVGLGAGVVTTAALPHATPAAFTAHEGSRHDYLRIADDQADTRADVMLGGGYQYYAPAGADSLRDDGGLIAPLAAAGYPLVTTAAELAAADPSAGKLLGLFAPEHLTYTVDRSAATGEPTLSEMALAAIDVLDRNPDGFFLMVEGARIDMASHGNDLERAIHETLAFDDAVGAVAGWASGRDDVTLLVTADHECGGLQVITPYGPGQLPDVSWRWGDHTNASVSVMASGPGADLFAGEQRDFTWVHAALAARIEDRPLAAPAPVLTPDGWFDDLRHTAATQTNPTSFGVGFNQLDALHLDADRGGLAVGVAGAFEWNKNAVVVLIDTDPGAGTGHASLAGALTDTSGLADSIISSLQLEAPPLTGFGADFAVAVFGGADPHVEDLTADAGLRGLVQPMATTDNLAWLGTAVNFADGVRAGPTAANPVAGRGLELYVPWSALYPALGGPVPANAEVAIAVVLVNDDGGYTSNQSLPPFPAGTDSPGRAPVALPGVIRFPVDSNGDGIADGDAAPVVP